MLSFPFRSSSLQLSRSLSFVNPLKRYSVRVNNDISTIPTPPTVVTRLENGMRVATEESFGQTATLGVWIDAGSVYENSHNNGTAHFLEHLAFKGTSRRSRIALEQEIEFLGAQLNAYTSREQTVYFARCMKEDIPQLVDVISDIIQYSKYETSAIENERSTILREMEEVSKNYEEVIFDHLHSVSFPDSSLGYTILGPEENIKRINRTEILDYVNNHYRPPRMVFAAAGAVTHQQIVDLTNKAFTKYNGDSKVPNEGQKNPQQPLDTTRSDRIPLINIHDEKIPKVYTAFAVKTPGWSDPDYLVCLLIQGILGQWDMTHGTGNNSTSRLCSRVAIERLGEAIMGFYTPYRSVGLLGVYGITAKELLPTFSSTIISEFQRIALSVSEEEVETAKARMKSSLLLSLDGTTPICEDIGRQVLTLGRRIPIPELFMRIESISQEDVLRVGSKVFRNVRPLVAATGASDNLPDYEQLQEWMRQ